MNDTILKFDYPNTLIKEYNHWVVLLRPAQVTIGSLVLACKSDAHSLSSMPLDSYKEFQKVTNDIESTLKSLFNYDKINYLALMMVDKEVHYHVIPRYANSINFNGDEYIDKDWPKPPDVLNSLEINEKKYSFLKQSIVKNWNDDNDRLKFSAIISVYKNDNSFHFNEALSSIVNQTLMPDEIVLVIDGEIPECIESVIKKHSTEKNDLIKVIRLAKNQGHAKARQVGVESASFDIIAIMDSDDISIMDRFEKQVNYLKENPDIDVLGCQIEEFIDDLENVVGIREVPLSDQKIKDYLKVRCPFNQQTVMMKKSSMLSAGGYIDWHYEEDYYLWIRMFEAGCKFQNIPDSLVKVRVGKEMYKRRGGVKYFISERNLQKYMLNKGIINYHRYTLNVIIRFVVQIMLPNSLRGLVFQHIFRTKKQI